jgi:hypothetical protein
VDPCPNPPGEEEFSIPELFILVAKSFFLPPLTLPLSPVQTLPLGREGINGKNF